MLVDLAVEAIPALSSNHTSMNLNPPPVANRTAWHVNGWVLPAAVCTPTTAHVPAVVPQPQEFDVVPSRTVREEFYSVYEEQVKVGLQ